MNSLVEETRQLIGLNLTSHQVSLLERFQQELNIWNERYSLTAISDPEKIRVKHFLDSFSPWLVMKDTPTDRLIDIGTGAGFPGIPLKILLPETEVVLVDSVQKKVEFCQHIIDLLDLEGISAVQERVERLAREPEYRESFDWVIARAVARLDTLSEYLLPFARIGGRALAMKGESGPSEVQNAEEAIKILGGELARITNLTLPGVSDERYLILIMKIAQTPEKYPRRVGVPGKRPI